MLIDIAFLNRKYNLKISGILHVGAHECEELESYKKIGVNDESILWIEGNKAIADRMKTKVKNVHNLLV